MFPPKSVVDPGFQQGGGANYQGAPYYNFIKISRQLHDFKEILVAWGVLEVLKFGQCIDINTQFR